MAPRHWAVGLVMAAIVAGLVFMGYEAYARPNADLCFACRRMVHPEMRTIAVVNGHARIFCCPACALSEHEQVGRPVRVTEVTGFLTGARLAPDNTFVVRGSDVNMCARKRELLDADKRRAGMQYDRCLPSMLAFRMRSDAEEFAREHGGEVLPFRRIVSAYVR